MTDDSTEKAPWEVPNYYSVNYGPGVQPVQRSNGNENFTLLTDGFGNPVGVYKYNLENQSQTYELFKPHNSLVPPNNYLPSMLSNCQESVIPDKTVNFDGTYWEVSNEQKGECSFNKTVHSEHSNTNKFNNPILNRLVADWTPGTSIYGDCLNNSTDGKGSNAVLPNDGQYTFYTQQQNSSINATKSLPNHVDKTSGIAVNQQKKPRIVAEVKPMTHRLSYSDVLSKNVPINNQASATAYVYNNSANQQQYQQPNINKKHQVKAQNNVNSTEKKGDDIGRFRKAGGLGNGTYAEKIQNFKGNIEIKLASGQKEAKEVDPLFTNDKKNNNKKKAKINKTKTKGGSQMSKADTFEKLGQINNLEDTFYDDNGEIGGPEKDDFQYESMYNVRKNDNYDKVSTKVYPGNKKPKANCNTSGNRLSIKQDKSYAKRTPKLKRGHRHQILQKLWIIWIEYLTKFILWLWSLVSDIVLLSLGIVWDKITVVQQYVKRFYESLKTEIGNNTNRPSVWFKNFYNQFDSRFTKQSKFAFWRRNFLRKPAEPIKDYYKDGKLPSTADEAMYSLLNCKGKDAYSILGVPSDCPQEQIRKHFHKIALLVHPDKNKQVGSEEAFKVLQRSFELIGEPENRQQYDQSLAEALNAEKAWSELNDLLKQLHTKIAEAANTIRCSSCSNRHPRKPNGRPHYAARECNSCRIRHSAREGDIWAETYFFGLRWKYLALMEGNVYDITEWANCQKGALAHLQPNSHIVQYRIVLGQNNQQQQSSAEKEKLNKKEQPSSDSTFDDILSNIYSGQNQQGQSNSSYRRRHKKN